MLQSFNSEISHLMTQAGDSFNTCSASCLMIEDQMMLEMENLAQRLIESVSMRSSTVIETDDFAFQLRKNKQKLHRLKDFLVKRKLLKKKCKIIEDEEIAIEPELELDIGLKPWKKRKVVKRKHFKILGDSEGPSLLFLDSYDSLSWSRMQRNDRITEEMTIKEYEEYILDGNKHSFLKKWSEIVPCFTKLIPSPYTLSKECGPIIGFLAHEMVQQLVESATRIFRDSVLSVSGICPHCTAKGTKAEENSTPNSSNDTRPPTTDKVTVVLPCLQPIHFNEVLRRFYYENGRFSLLLL